ncbi:hypothetical protein Hte_009812 [Hypoxylon texense]
MAAQQTAQAMSIDKRLKMYFEGDSDARFSFAGIHNQGTTAMTWKVTYQSIHKTPQQTTYGPPQHLVLKTQKPLNQIPEYRAMLFSGSSRRKGFIPNERRWVERFKWAEHFVKPINIPDDPLRIVSSDDRQNNWPEWIYLEWIGNGSLRDFVMRAKFYYEFLPNRLLWRFFLCLMLGNLAFQVEGGYPEHDFTPSLKLIDFGDARDLNDDEEVADYLKEWYDRSYRYAMMQQGIQVPARDNDGDVKMSDIGIKQLGEDDLDFARPDREPMGDDRGMMKNIYDVGKVMLELALLDRTLPLRTKRMHIRYGYGGQGPLFSTTAVELFTPDSTTGQERNPGLDPALRLLIGLCLAEDPRNRPPLHLMERYLETEIVLKSFEFYNPTGTGDLTESDINIRNIIQRTVLDAHP